MMVYVVVREFSDADGRAAIEVYDTDTKAEARLDELIKAGEDAWYVSRKIL